MDSMADSEKLIRSEIERHEAEAGRRYPAAKRSVAEAKLRWAIGEVGSCDYRRLALSSEWQLATRQARNLLFGAWA